MIKLSNETVNITDQVTDIYYTTVSIGHTENVSKGRSGNDRYLILLLKE